MSNEALTCPQINEKGLTINLSTQLCTSFSIQPVKMKLDVFMVIIKQIESI